VVLSSSHEGVSVIVMAQPGSDVAEN